VASFTITAAPWPAGTSVAVYPAAAWMNTAAQPSGAPVSGGVVTSIGTVAFTGLADTGRYVAYATGTGVRFATATSGLQQSVAIPDRERIAALELGGTGSGSGGTPGLIIVTAPGDPLPSPAGQAATTLWIRMRE
jgi:type IV secretory pathway VirB9-like protein